MCNEMQIISHENHRAEIWLAYVETEYIAELARTKKVLNFPHISYPSFDDEGAGIWGQDEHWAISKHAINLEGSGIAP